MRARDVHGGHRPEVRFIRYCGEMTRMTATDAARSFSDVLNRVASGEEIEVTRSGTAVAVISPARSTLISAERFRALIATAPSPDPSFLDDVRTTRNSVVSPGDAWPS